VTSIRIFKYHDDFKAAEPIDPEPKNVTKKKKNPEKTDIKNTADNIKSEVINEQKIYMAL